MWSKRDIIIFLAGAQAFHTLSHMLLGVSGSLPLRFFSITLGQNLNLIAIIINALATIGLLLWASRLQ
jgi:hypothetical protein